jgi:hypothetical protein
LSATGCSGAGSALTCGMRYTQGQIRGLLDISVETFRAWREAVPALGRHKGHAPTFAPGDVVALAVVADLVRDFGTKVGTLTDRLEELFATCHGMSWLSLEPCVVLIDRTGVRLVSADDPRRLACDRNVLVMPCAPIVERLRRNLIAAEPEEAQGRLRFPLSGLAGGSAS